MLWKEWQNDAEIFRNCSAQVRVVVFLLVVECTKAQIRQLYLFPKSNSVDRSPPARALFAVHHLFKLAKVVEVVVVVDPPPEPHFDN